MWAPLNLLAILVVKATALRGTSEDIEQRFTEFMIVPQIIPDIPPYLLTIIYGPNRVNLGTVLPVCAVNQEPLISWPNPNDDILYTLIAFTTSITGSLATNNNNLTITQLVFNIPGADIQQGDLITPYIPPNPLLGVGYRRYISLLYRQVGPIEVTAALYTRVATTYYRNFDIIEFVEDFNLNLIAGNFFLCKRTLCDATCCSTNGNGCGSQAYSSSYSIGCNSYDTSCTYIN